MDSICVFGDSTAWGAWDLEKGGWVNRLWLFLGETKEKDEIFLYNLSVDGGTTETILARFESEAKIRKADGLIFQTGGNDALYEREEGNYWVAPEKFEKNLEEIIQRARKITPNIIFVGFKNCDESKTTPVPWGDLYYTNENIKKYNGIMKEVCSKNGVLFLEIFGIMNKENLEDGIHPNAVGHNKIFNLVKDFLIKDKWI